MRFFCGSNTARLCLAGLFVATLILCCTPATAPSLKIGVIYYDWSTEFNIEGYSTQMAAEIALTDEKTSPGIPLTLIYRKVDMSPESSVTAVQDLVNREGVSAIVGPSMSTQAIPAGAAAEKAGVPLVSQVSSNPKTTKDRRFVFRMCFLDPQQARAQVLFAVQELGRKRLGLVFEGADPSSSSQADVIRQTCAELNLPLVHESKLELDEPDWSGEIAALASVNLDLVFLPAGSDFAKRAGLQLRKAGFKGVFVGGDGWTREEFKSLQDFDGSFMTTNYWAGIETPENQDFVIRYKALTTRVPGDTAALTYDAVRMIAATARRVDSTDTAKIQAGLMDGTVWKGISGPLSFHDSGNPDREVVFIGFKDGVIMHRLRTARQ